MSDRQSPTSPTTYIFKDTYKEFHMFLVLAITKEVKIGQKGQIGHDFRIFNRPKHAVENTWKYIDKTEHRFTWFGQDK